MISWPDPVTGALLFAYLWGPPGAALPAPTGPHQCLVVTCEYKRPYVPTYNGPCILIDGERQEKSKPDASGRYWKRDACVLRPLEVSQGAEKVVPCGPGEPPRPAGEIVPHNCWDGVFWVRGQPK